MCKRIFNKIINFLFRNKTIIPKQINYCYLSDNDLPNEFKYCINSWKDNMPGYTIKKWGKDIIDKYGCDYAKQALDYGNYAVASDWVRIYSLYTDGGIYFDCDVKSHKILPNDFHTKYNGWIPSRDYDFEVTAEIMGFRKGHPLLKYILDWYDKQTYNPNCIQLAPKVFGNLICQYYNQYIYGENSNKITKLNKYDSDDLIILPYNWFDININSESYCTHLGCASWGAFNYKWISTIDGFKLPDGYNKNIYDNYNY